MKGEKATKWSEFWENNDKSAGFYEAFITFWTQEMISWLQFAE